MMRSIDMVADHHIFIPENMALLLPKISRDHAAVIHD